MNIQDKYKWNSVKLQGQLWANGLSQKTMDLHNDAIEALAIELGQQGNIVGNDDRGVLWQELMEIDDFFRDIQKELNAIKRELSELEKDK